MAEDIRVRSEMKGTFTQGTFGALYVKIYDQGGSPVDGVDVAVTITNADTSDVVVEGVPVKLARGVYLYDWQVAGDQAPGVYTVTWNYTASGVSRTEVQQVVVAEASNDGGIATGIMAMIRLKLEYMIAGIQAINLNFLQANDSEDLKTY